jgi:hypothetical protein
MSSYPNNPTFNRSNQNGVSQGFHSRTLLSYTPVSLDNLSDTNVTNNIDFDGIDYLRSLEPGNFFGSNRLPAKYWRSGKTIRIHGTILADTIPPEEPPIATIPFNMKFGLTERNGFNTDWLAYTNNGDDHYIFDGTFNVGPVPIDFFCDITCCEIDFENDYIGFIAAGYFQYNDTDYNSGGTNIVKKYVPVYTETFSIGHDTTFYNYETDIMWNLYSTSVYVYHIYVTNLTIEELA